MLSMAMATNCRDHSHRQAYFVRVLIKGALRQTAFIMADKACHDKRSLPLTEVTTG